MESVDNQFWKMVEPYVRKVVAHNWNSFEKEPLVSIKEITKNLMNSLVSTKNVVFIHAPMVRSKDWPEHIRKRFFKDVDESKDWRNKRPEDDWIFVELEGTTFSGHSTRTTLGNTLRSLMYAWYYLKKAGIKTPWASKDCYVIASGDDVVIFVRPDLADKVK